MSEDWQAKWKKRKVSKNLILIDKKIYKAKRILFKKKNEENGREEKRREDRIRREKTRQVERKEKKRKDERR